MQHTTTRIYSRSLELVALAKSVIGALPPGHAFLADQLRRASSSVVLNYAEGAGKRSLRDRRRYFDTARASAFEVAAALDVAHILGTIDHEIHETGLDLCDHLGAMLFRYR